MDEHADNDIRRARGGFLAMAGAYSLGALNDNFFKMAVVLFCNRLAEQTGGPTASGWVPYLMALPYLLFASYAGFLADRFSKRKIVIAAKALELGAMAAAAMGLWTGNWPLLWAMVFVMGAQSAMFSPALNGSIPEVYPAWYVPKANGRLKAAIVVAILLGTGLAGVAMGVGDPVSAGGVLVTGRKVAAGCVAVIAVAGLLASFWVAGRGAADPKTTLPLLGPIDTVRDLVRYHRDALLAKIIWANAFIWGIGSLQILIIMEMGQRELGLGETKAGLLAAVEMVGLAIGGLLGGRLASRERWYRSLPLLAGAIGGAALLVGMVPAMPGPWQVPSVSVLLGLAGIAGGMFLVPCESFIQVRSPESRRGAVIAASNFAVFAAICATGLLHVWLTAYLTPIMFFACLALLAFPMGVLLAWLLWPTIPRDIVDVILQGIIRSLLWLRYRVKVRGLYEIKARGRRGIVFLANHTALIDPIIMAGLLHGSLRVRFLADRDQVDRPVIRTLARRIGVVTIPDVSKYGPQAAAEVEAAVGKLADLLSEGENVLLYPAGQLCRGRLEDLKGNSAVETILRHVPEVRVVLVRHRGLWGSGFSYASGRTPLVGKTLMRGIKGLLASGIFFAPRRHVDVEFVEPPDVPAATEGREVINAYLEAFYNADRPGNTFVPYSIWDRSGVRPLTEREAGPGSGLVDVPEGTRAIVSEHLREVSGVDDVTAGRHLARDLGLDSLARAELLAWLEGQFGVSGGDSDSIRTVGDVMLAACGEAVSSGHDDVPAPSRAWRTSHRRGLPVEIPEGSTICEVFLAQARRDPTRVIAADSVSGPKTYRDLITAVLALKPHVAKIPGRHVGIMLPASVAADVALLTVLFSGKVPVMINWTSGRRGVEHAADSLDVRAVLTARALLTSLKAQGVDLGRVAEQCLCLEDLGGAIGTLGKLRAAAKARGRWGELAKVDVPETAVILFTSGSETLPKAVPLTHANILTNLRDVLVRVTLRPSDRMLGMLPPFHSFGLTAAIGAPLLAGMPVVHSPDPTQAGVLAATVEAYGVTVLMGTPTFLGGIVRAALPGQLDTLRLAVTGAEACPPRVYDALATCCPNATVLEGYGVTECSPIVSLNDEDSPRRCTIGRVLGSIEYVIVDETMTAEVSSGSRGQLLVRGPSIFGGYLHVEGSSPFAEFGGRQWYHTGDLVCEDSSGVLTFLGRLKRFVKLGGEMVSLPAVEAALEPFAGAAGQDGPVLAVTASPGERPELTLFSAIDIDRESANARIFEAGLSSLHFIRRVIRIEALPLLGTGKTDYRALADRLEG